MFQEIAQMGKHSAVYSLGEILPRLATIFLVPMYTFYFTTADYGSLEILSNTSSLLATFLGLGMISAMYRSYFMYQDESRRMDVAKTALVLLIASSSLLLIPILFRKQISYILLADQTQNSTLGLVFITIILGNLLIVPYAALRAKSQSIRYVILSLIQLTVNIGFTIYLVAFQKRGVQGSFEGTLLGQIAILLLFLPFYLQVLKAHFSRLDLKEMLSFGIPLVPGMLASLSLTVADRYFMRAYLTFNEIGVYALGYKIGMMLQVLVVTPFALSWGPMMWSVAGKPYAKNFYARVLTYFSLIALFVALGLSMLSPEFVKLMSRREAYWDAWKVVPLIALSYVLFGMYYQMSVGVSLNKKTSYISLIAISAAILNLLLNYTLIPSWGTMGAALATLLSYLYLAIAGLAVAQRFYPFSYEWKRLIILAVISFGLFGLSFLISTPYLLLSTGLKILLLICFPVILWVIRFFSPDEQQRIRQLMLTLIQRLKFTFGLRNISTETGQPSNNKRRVLIIGSGEDGMRLSHQIEKRFYSELSVVGFVDDNPGDERIRDKILGTLDQTQHLVQNLIIDDIVFAPYQNNHPRTFTTIADLQNLPAKIWIYPDYYLRSLEKGKAKKSEHQSIHNIRLRGLNNHQRKIKRLFDILVTIFVLPISFLISCIIAIVIRLDGKGPIIFKQLRVGENGKLFGIYKFRSMIPEAEALRELVEYQNKHGQLIHKTADDPRVTRLGKFLRKASLDELPQLLNVLKGDMSLVGPRPELLYLMDQYQDWQLERLLVPQGITGWWQIHGRSDKPMHLHTEDDLYYIQNYSLKLDIYVLMKTMGAVLRRRGAY